MIALATAARSVSVTALAFVASGCVPDATSPVDARPSWSVSCTKDVVTNSERCSAGTFGRLSSSDGQAYGSASYPFQVYFEGGKGPFVLAGHHTFPGRNPQVRFDDDSSAFVVPDDGGVSMPRPAENIVSRMQGASVAYVRFHSGPEGSRDMIVQVSGFSDAYQRLLKIKGAS